MKKSKLSVGLVASFIGALALSACDTSTPAVTSKEGSLVELVNYNGDKIEIKTDDLYGKISESSDGRRIYYNAVLEALIRYEYPKLNSELNLGVKSYDSLKKEAEDKIKSSKETANDNASTNGTSYDEEWDKILESNDCETEKDLLQHFIYDLEKEELSDWYAKNNINSLKDEYLGINKDWSLVAEDKKVENVDSLFPYHILHVLVTLSADKDDYNRGTITESEAKKLWSVVRDLIDPTYSFDQVASNLSDDTGSKAKFGDVGIMSTKTSFYNEFKLGIYAYDAILSGVNDNDASTSEIYNAFGLSDDATIITETTSTGITEEDVVDVVKEEMATNVVTPVTENVAAVDRTIPTVPYSVFKLISEKAEDTKIGALAPEAGDVALPRNVVYNQFLNFHSPFLVTNEDIVLDDNATVDDLTDDSITLVEHDFEDEGTELNPNFYIKNANFIDMHINGEDKKVLADRDGNVIIGVRSEAGIHFMLMRKSVFKATNESVAVGTGTKADQSLQDYYTTLIPSDEGFPEGETYVKMVEYQQNDSYYKDRVDEIKSALKSSDFDAAYDYRLYEFLLNNDLVKDHITFADSKVKDNIDEYIKLLRETKSASDAKSINESWQNYLLMLRYQNYQRSLEGALMPTTCAFYFNDGVAGHSELFEKGGVCYVK